MGLWIGGLHRMAESSRTRSQGAAKDMTPQLMTQVRELQHHVERLTLLNQALWEILRDRLGLTDHDFEEMAREIDLRDGVLDGKITNTPLQCPQCGRVSASKHYRCLYCGLEFQKPVIG